MQILRVELRWPSQCLQSGKERNSRGIRQLHEYTLSSLLTYKVNNVKESGLYSTITYRCRCRVVITYEASNDMAFAHLYCYIKAFAILALEMNTLVITTRCSGVVRNTTKFQLEVKLSGFIYPAVLYPLTPLTVKSSATLRLLKYT